MNSSGIKRGLAASAISALAVTGVPLAAFATTVADQVGTGNVVLYSQYAAGNDGSLKNDGTDTTIQLAAGGGSNVTSVKFSYQIGDAAVVDIATVSRDAHGLFAYDWNASNIAGATVTLTATALDADNQVVDTDVRNDVTVQPVGNAATSVALAEGSSKGVFQQPYSEAGHSGDLTSFNGTTSDASGDVTVSVLDGATALADVVMPVKDADGTGSGTTGAFAGVMDITGYDYSVQAGGTDEIVVGAAHGTDDVEAYTLYQQSIADAGTTVVAAPASGTVDGANKQDVVVTVLDKFGAPIIGAQVFESGTGDVQYTGIDGKTPAFQAGEGTHSYYVNNNDTDAYEPGQGDKLSNQVVISSYKPESTNLVASSEDGKAFDYDEYADGDITLQVTDQNGKDFKEVGRKVNYTWTLESFDGTNEKPSNKVSGSALTDADGTAVIPLPTGHESGTWTLAASLEGRAGAGTGAIAEQQELTVKAGEAEIVFDESSPEQALFGTDETVGGSLELEDGTGLPGRVIDVSLDSTDAVIVQDGVDDTTATVTTDNGGAFSVVVDDPTFKAPATEQAEEFTTLYAETVTTPDIGDAGAEGQTDVDFLSSVTPADIDTWGYQLIDGEATPGRPVTLDVFVGNGPADADGTDGLSNTDVKVSATNGAFFTPGAWSADELTPAGKAGDLYGEWKDLGSSTTVTTDGDGYVPVTVAMEKNADFDDDGIARTTVTLKAGNVTETYKITFTSVDALNIDDIEAVPTDETADDLPEVQTREDAEYDVFAHDQFGNLTKVGYWAEDDTPYADVTYGDNGEVCYIDPFGNLKCDNVGGDAATQFLLDDPSLVASSDSETEQNIVVTADDTTGQVNGDEQAPALAAQGVMSQDVPNPQSDEVAAISWYKIDFAASTFTLQQEGDETVPVNGGVTEVLTALDQKGAPIEGLYVEFFRSGPSDQPGDDNDAMETNGDGEATYNFTGTEVGTATVNAVIYEDGSRANQIGTESDTVTFEKVREQREIKAGLVLSNTRNGSDRAEVFANPTAARGAVVKLFKVRNDGSKKLVARDTLNRKAEATFVVEDKNGGRKTRYVAKVAQTVRTLADWSKTRGIS